MGQRTAHPCTCIGKNTGLREPSHCSARLPCKWCNNSVRSAATLPKKFCVLERKPSLVILCLVSGAGAMPGPTQQAKLLDLHGRRSSMQVCKFSTSCMFLQRNGRCCCPSHAGYTYHCTALLCLYRGRTIIGSWHPLNPGIMIWMQSTSAVPGAMGKTHASRSDVDAVHVEALVTASQTIHKFLTGSKKALAMHQAGSELLESQAVPRQGSDGWR